MNDITDVNHQASVVLAFPGKPQQNQPATEQPARQPEAYAPDCASQIEPAEDAAAKDADAILAPAVPTVPSTSTMSSATVATQSLPSGFASFPDGIYELPNADSEPVFVCSPLRVAAMFSDANGSGWGRLVEIRDDDGRMHDVQVTNADLSRRPAEVLARLLDRGLTLGHAKDAKDRLIRLLKLWKPEDRMTTISQLGWADDSFRSFAIGDTVIGEASVLPHNSLSRGPARHLVGAGSLDGWRANIGLKCKGNPLMIIAVSLALSGPLLALLGESGGGLHFRGASSSGKTTLLRIAASVWGDRGLIGQWRATSNGLEGTAAALNDMLLPLDEIAEISPRALHEAIYMLANGKAKSRMTKDAVLGETAAWRVAIISSGEISVEEKMKEAKLGTMTGHEVRLVDIEADARRWGVFDNLHGSQSAGAFADQLRKAATEHYGLVGREYVRRLVNMVSATGTTHIEAAVREYVDGWVDALPSAADGPTLRVARRFAVVADAGILASDMGLTGFSKDDVLDAVKQTFLDWYDRRYGSEREAADGAVRKLKLFLQGETERLQDLTAPSPSSTVSLGWCDATRAYLPADTWSSLFPGIDGTNAAKALMNLHLLVPGENGRIMRKAPHAIEGRPRLYTLNLDRIAAYRTE